MISLGQKLKNTLDELERAKLKTLEEKTNADLNKIRAERVSLNCLVDKTIQHFVSMINENKVPQMKIRDYADQRWIRNAIKKTAAHQDIWDGFSKWARDNQLTVITNESHDGKGIDSWITLSVLPLDVFI